MSEIRPGLGQIRPGSGQLVSGLKFVWGGGMNVEKRRCSVRILLGSGTLNYKQSNFIFLNNDFKIRMNFAVPTAFSGFSVWRKIE